MVRLLLAPVVEPVSCLLDRLAAARNGNGNLQRKTIGKCVRQHKCGILGAVGHCEEFDPALVHRVKMRTRLHRQDVRSMVLDVLVPQMVEQLLEVPKIIPQDRISQRTAVVYKNAVESRRAARRVITCVEQKEKFKGKEQLTSYARVRCERGR